MSLDRPSLVLDPSFLAAVNVDLLPDAADTRSLGSTALEWLNLYIGSTGKIYFGLAQDVNLYRSAAGVLKTDDYFHAGAGRVYVGADTMLYRYGANILASDDHFLLPVGKYLMHDEFVVYRPSDGVIAVHLAAAGPVYITTRSKASDSLIGDFYIRKYDYDVPGYVNVFRVTEDGILDIGAAGDVNLYRSAANILKTDDAFDAASFKVGGVAGASGSFTTVDGKTVTVTNGIITSIV